MPILPDYDSQTFIDEYKLRKFVDIPFEEGYYVQAFSVLECFIVAYFKQIAKWKGIKLPKVGKKQKQINVQDALNVLNKLGLIDDALKKDIEEFRGIRGDFVHNPEHEIYRHILETNETRKNQGLGIPMAQAVEEWETTVANIKKDLDLGKKCCFELNKIFFDVCPIKPERYYEHLQDV